MGMKETASRLIVKYGQAATLLRAGPPTQNAYGEEIPGVDTEYPVTILSATYAVEIQYIAAGLINVGDRRVFLSADGLTIEPEIADRLLIGGEEFSVARVSLLAPAGEEIFYELQVRNAG